MRRWSLSLTAALVVPYRPDTASTLEKSVIPRREPIRTAKQVIEWASAKTLPQRLDGTFKSKPISKDGPRIKELAGKWLKLSKPDEEISGATYNANRSHMDVHLLPASGDLPMAVFEDVQGQWTREVRKDQTNMV